MKITLHQLEPNLKFQHEKLLKSSSGKKIKESAKIYHIENIIGGIATTVFVNMIRINQLFEIPETVLTFGSIKRYKMIVEVSLCSEHCETEATLINHLTTLAFDEIMIIGTNRKRLGQTVLECGDLSPLSP